MKKRERNRPAGTSQADCALSNFIPTQHPMKNIVDRFTVYPFGRGRDEDRTRLYDRAVQLIKLFGEPKTDNPYNAGGGIHCVPHDNVELKLIHLGGVEKVVAVQMYSGDEVVMAGFVTCLIDNLADVEVPRQDTSIRTSYTIGWYQQQ